MDATSFEEAMQRVATEHVPFTSAMFKAWTQEQIRAFYVASQHAKKARGEKHFTHLIDVATGETVWSMAR